jgi:D-3-phosphoglycerate dehydrogenase
MDTLILEPTRYSSVAIEKYKKLGPVYLTEHPAPERLEIVVVRLAHKIDEMFLARYPNLKHIVSPTTGLTHIDLDFCKQKSIQVWSLKGEAHLDFLKGITSTAELAWLHIMAACRGWGAATQHVREGNWDRDKFISQSLKTLTLGIVGHGRIGALIANYAKTFQMRVLVHDPNPRLELDHHVERFSLDALLSSSDVVVLAASYEQGQSHIFDAKKFQLMKAGASFVNIARGELIDESALLEELRLGRLKSVGLDVLRGEPFEHAEQNPWLKEAKINSNVQITPHIGGACLDAMMSTEEYLAEYFLARVKL